jgi:hypothetical protein
VLRLLTRPNINSNQQIVEVPIFFVEFFVFCQSIALCLEKSKMDEHDPYNYERMNEVDHSHNPCTRRYPHKASATSSTTADDNPASDSTSNKAYIPLADATKSDRQSFFLSWKAILGFAAFFVTMIVALEVMFRQSERHVGLATSSSSKHYLWTYRPTAGEKALLMIEETT